MSGFGQGFGREGSRQEPGQGFGQGFGHGGSVFGSSSFNNAGPAPSTSPFSTIGSPNKPNNSQPNGTSMGNGGGNSFVSGFGSSSNVAMPGVGGDPGFGSTENTMSTTMSGVGVSTKSTIDAFAQSQSMAFSTSMNAFGSSSFGNKKGCNRDASLTSTTFSPFGSSPNVAISNNSNSNSNINNDANNTFPFGNGGINGTKKGTTTMPFGSMGGSTSFGQQGSGDGGGGGSLSDQKMQSPFGASSNVKMNSDNTMHPFTTSGGGFGQSPNLNMSGGIEKQEKQGHHADKVFISRPSSAANIEEKLTRQKELKEEIEKKKKAMMEMINNRGKEPPKMNPDATPFVPVSGSNTAKPVSLTSTSISTSASEKAQNLSREHRNPKNLATKNRSSVSLLPPDLKNRQNNPTSSPTQETSSATSVTTKNVKSLIGTCLHMCPDEELLQREEEGNLQLLELPITSEGGKCKDGSVIHPQDWTLRNTAVKRFCRSSADYKLDIPELIRPPYVLERVCAYLEEWVMERDRQGPDPRFDGRSPPPLDVYQFIWDRTRMIRKDFILQNYSGSAGGKCSAAAVRCHERIARWHAMCEHQLSHIPEYVKMQSQQNIQELGQTLKSLNYYYDDVERRAILEEEEDGGISSIIHGCQNNCVMGNTPVDYDGEALDNQDSTKKRLIGVHGPSAGTAEPEMRSLYILLTLNIDGGMEVLKYAGRLSVERPEVFNSTPVQLALEVYKVKKEHNYARFFAILRSPSTPYLFSCVMFKYVEHMRKVAFRIMSKTYGAQTRDGKRLNDTYPLANLVKLLCFEDLEEAINACTHYNIKVEKVSLSSYISEEERMSGTSNPNQEEYAILWKASKFKEAVCPKRGVILALGPRKMKRTIEKKASGITRLGVCRGEISFGATLSQRGLERSSPMMERKKKEKEARDKILLKKVQKELQLKADLEKKAAEAKAQAEKERLRKEEEANITRAKEEKKRKAAETKAQAEKERLRKEEKVKIARAKEEMKRKAAEAKIQAEAKAHAEKERSRKEEEAKIARSQEEMKRKVAEAKAQAEKERLRKEEEAKKARAQEEVKRKVAEAKAQAQKERLRKEEEARVQEEIKRKAEEEARRLIEMRWQAKIDLAKKIFIIKKWQTSISQKKYRRDCTRKCLECFDPIGQTLPSSFNSVLHKKTQVKNKNPPGKLDIHSSCTHEDILYRLGTDSSRSIDLSKVFHSALREKSELNTSPGHSVVLFKLAVIVTDKNTVDISKLVKMWIDTRLNFNVVCRKNFGGIDVRTVVVCRELESAHDDGVDSILFVIPPTSSLDESKSFKAISCVQHRVPYLVLRLDYSEPKLTTYFGINDKDEGMQFNKVCNRSKEDQYEHCLYKGCETLIQDFINTIYDEKRNIPVSMVERVPVRKLCCVVMRRAMWEIHDNAENLPTHLQREVFNRSEEKVIENCRETLIILLQEISSMSDNIKNGRLSCWPGHEFLGLSSCEVPMYFTGNKGLPKNWRQTLETVNVKEMIWDMFPSFAQPTQATAVLEQLLSKAPLSVRQMCGEMFKDKQTQRCFDSAFQWHESIFEESGVEPIFYLPHGEVENIINVVIKNLIQETLTDLSDNASDAGPSPLLEFSVDEPLNEQDSGTESHYVEKSYLPSPSSSKKSRKNKRSITSYVNDRCNLSQNKEENIDFKRQKTNDVDGGDDISELCKSKLYTNKLQAFLDGEITIDLGIGDTTLADILSHNCMGLKTR